MAVALALPDVAVMVTSPGARGATNPGGATEAEEASELDQETMAPDRTSPSWSRTVAVSRPVAPSAYRVNSVGDRVREVGI